jgi:uncharacterized membrane protein YhiD involved in acid resistance
MHISKRSLETLTCAWLLMLTVLSIVPLYAQVPPPPGPAQPGNPLTQQQPAGPPQTMLENIAEDHRQSLGSWEIDLHAFVALPLATALGAALAMRPRRKGTPKRSAPVVQTQIILAVIGALVMIVVGTSLARAFGVVGAAGLVRYRAKIDDPKDAGVMLTTLAVGLGAGIGVYGLAVFATIFLMALLWVIESFEPSARKEFILEIKAKEVAKLQPKIEAVLRRKRVKYEIREAAPEELSYFVQLPMDVKTDGISAEVMAIDPDPGTSVEWKTEKKKAA